MSNAVKLGCVCVWGEGGGGGGGEVPYSEIGILKYSFSWFEPGGRWKACLNYS